MRIHILRHGDPDYEKDTLTGRGHMQARALGKLLAGYPIHKIYSSPAGRTKATAKYTADRLGLVPVILPWLREMNDIVVPGKMREDLAVWHIPARDLLAMAQGAGAWMEHELIKNTGIKNRMAEICSGTGALLDGYGLSEACGGYTMERDLSEAGDIAVFCHQGIGLTWMAMLMGICPPDLWRTCYIPPASISTLLVEQSEPGFASFRLLRLGDISHLYGDGVESNMTGLLYNIV